jgi:hypothetical protein
MTAHVLSVAALTREDHRKLAKHYSTHAADHVADATYHEKLASQYDKTLPQLASAARHYAAHSMEAAEALRNLATQHGKLGK